MGRRLGRSSPRRPPRRVSRRVGPGQRRHRLGAGDHRQHPHAHAALHRLGLLGPGPISRGNVPHPEASRLEQLGLSVGLRRRASPLADLRRRRMAGLPAGGGCSLAPPTPPLAATGPDRVRGVGAAPALPPPARRDGGRAPGPQQPGDVARLLASRPGARLRRRYVRLRRRPRFSPAAAPAPLALPAAISAFLADRDRLGLAVAPLATARVGRSPGPFVGDAHPGHHHLPRAADGGISDARLHPDGADVGSELGDLIR